MDDTISRQEAIEALYDWERCYDWDEHCREEDPKPAYIISPSDIIEKLPSVQPERKKGKWIERESGTEDKENGFDTVIVCSCCDFPATTFYSEDCESRTQIRTDFCPNCGADMRGDADE